MKVSVEIRDEDGMTTYSADLSKWEESAKKVAKKVGDFFEETFSGVFKKETFTREKEE